MKKNKSVSASSLDGQLKAIYQAGHVGNFLGDHDEPYQTFGDLIFRGAEHANFSRAIQTLHESNKSIYETISKTKFTEKVLEKIRGFYDQQNINFSGLWKLLSKELLELPITSFEIMREIHGITLSRPDEIACLGPFSIYEFESQRNLLEAKVSPKKLVAFWGNPPPKYLIGLKVSVRDATRAYEVTDIQFERFERILKFLVARPDEKTEVGILNYRGPKRQRAYVFVEKSAGSLHRNLGPFTTLHLDDPFFKQPDIAKFWELIVNEGNQLERRLMLAADWTGQSYGDKTRPSSFLKSAIALEILFTPQENAIIIPSILSSISEALAILLADTAVERLQVERQVKKLYAKRSSIAHSGSADVSPLETHEIQTIARAAIFKIFTLKESNHLQSTDELFSLVKMNKYSGPSLPAKITK